MILKECLQFDQTTFVTVLKDLLVATLSSLTLRGSKLHELLGFVHLTKGTLAVTIELDDTSVDHFVVKIDPPFSRTFAHTTENRVTTVSLGDGVDQPLRQHCLADTSTSPKSPTTSTAQSS
ncbi:hypothetical protein G6F21_013019 [Rhizopus arrhizus]|nr:hypothetical protein G6F21_013019 [Rhizopus arrhizus]